MVTNTRNVSLTQAPPEIIQKVRQTFLIIGICLTAASIYSAFSTYQFTRTATRVDGVVVDLAGRITPNSTTRTFSSVIQYTDKHGLPQKHYSTVSTNPPSHQLGQKVTLLLDPNDPKNTKIDSTIELWLFTGILTLIANVFVGIGFLLNKLLPKQLTQFQTSPPNQQRR